MRLVDYLALLRQRVALVIVVVGVVAMIALGLSFMHRPIYEADVRLRALPIAPSAFGSGLDDLLSQSSVSFTDLGTEAELVKSVDVGNRVIGKLGLATTPSELTNHISVIGLPNTRILLLTARAEEPALAADLANTFAESYLEARRDSADEALDRAEERLSARVQDARLRLEQANELLARAAPDSLAHSDAGLQRDLALADLSVLRSQMRALAERSALEGGFGEVIAPATASRLVRDTSPLRALVFGFMLGGPLAFAVVLLLENLSQTVRNEADAEDCTGAVVLGAIPADERLARASQLLAVSTNGKANGRAPNGLRRLLDGRRNNGHGAQALVIVESDPFSAVAEAYRSASLNIETAAREAGVSTVLVTSPLANEGKTTTVVNVVNAHAERGHPMVLVDADLRRPSAHDIVGADPAPGLAELADGDATVRKVIQEVRPFLKFVAAGEPVERPDQMLTRRNVRAVVDKLSASTRTRSNGSSEGSTIVFDSAPVLQATETLALAQGVDAVVLVLRAGVTRQQAAVRAADQIRRAGARVLGVLLVETKDGSELGFDRVGSNGRRLMSLNGGHAPHDRRSGADVT